MRSGAAASAYLDIADADYEGWTDNARHNNAALRKIIRLALHFSLDNRKYAE